MTDDLIERLRQWPNMCPDAADAADEIERIGALWRAAENNEQLRAAMLTCQAAEIERLRAEIERLRSEARVYQDTMQWEQRERELQAEIEQLRAERDELFITNGELAIDLTKLQRALYEFGEHAYECELKEPNGLCTCGYDRALEPKP